MNAKNNKYLLSKYHKLFPKKTKDSIEPVSLFGIECDDGWFELIDTLCNTISTFVSQNKVEPVIIEQVKEKFGGLRFYFIGGNDLIRGMAWFAEALSFNICEVCGNPGELREDGYVRTLCDKCNKSRLESRKLVRKAAKS